MNDLTLGDVMNHRLEIRRNAEGHKLAYLSPVNENNETESGYRIAGPKAWGGSKLLAEIDIAEEDLFTYIKQYVEQEHNDDA